jgi:hypothetical protein
MRYKRRDSNTHAYGMAEGLICPNKSCQHVLSPHDLDIFDNEVTLICHECGKDIAWIAPFPWSPSPAQAA